MASHRLLDNSNANLTCNSNPELLRRHLLNEPQCHLTESETKVELLFVLYLPILLCCTGVFFNVVNFLIFRKQHFDGAAYSYMAAISLVDAVFLVVYIFYALTAVRCDSHITRFPCNTWAFAYLQLGLVHLNVYLSATVNFSLQTLCAWLTVILGIERYVAMKYFHFRRTRCHRTDTKLTVAVVTVASFLFNLPHSFTNRPIHRISVTGNVTQEFMVIEKTQFGRSFDYAVYSFVKLAASSLLPFAALALNNLMLLILVIRHQRRRSFGRDQKYLAVKRASKVLQASLNRIQAQKNLTILLIVMIFVFLCGQVPRSLLFQEIFALFRTSCPCGSALLWVCCPLYRRLHILCELLYLICLNLNFFIYFSLNKHFRSHISLGCRRRQQQLSVGLDLFSAAGATTCDGHSSSSQQEQQQQQQQQRCSAAPKIIYEIPIHGSPTAQCKHSCQTISEQKANSVVANVLCEQRKSISEEGYGARDELEDLVGTTVMVSQL